MLGVEDQLSYNLSITDLCQQYRDAQGDGERPQCVITLRGICIGCIDLILVLSWICGVGLFVIVDLEIFEVHMKLDERITNGQRHYDD